MPEPPSGKDGRIDGDSPRFILPARISFLRTFFASDISASTAKDIGQIVATDRQLVQRANLETGPICGRSGIDTNQHQR